MPLTPIPGFVEFFTDRDSWFVKQQTKIILVIFGLFFVSMVMSCQDLRYMVSGKTTDAALNTHVETEVRDGQKWVHRVAGYSYVDNGQSRQNYVTVPMDWPLTNQQTVKVQYIPGSDRSRFYGETNRVWVFIFFGSLVAAVMGGIVLARSG